MIDILLSFKIMVFLAQNVLRYGGIEFLFVYSYRNNYMLAFIRSTYDMFNDILFLGSKCLFVLVILQITILNTIEKCTLVSAQQCVNAFCLCDCYMCFYVCVWICVYSHVHTTYFTLVHFNLVWNKKIHGSMETYELYWNHS